MIVCHCMNIADHDIRAAVDWMRAADPDTLITPCKVYRARGKTADCGGCMPLFLDPLRIGQNLRETLECDLAGEHDPRTLYIEGRCHCDEVGDDVSRALFDELIADEEGHIDFLETQLDLFDKLGEERYALLNAKPAGVAE